MCDESTSIGTYQVKRRSTTDRRSAFVNSLIPMFFSLIHDELYSGAAIVVAILFFFFLGKEVIIECVCMGEKESSES